MKKVLFLLLVLAALLIGACSENDDPTDVNIYGYKLHQFIDKAAVNASWRMMPPILWITVISLAMKL